MSIICVANLKGGVGKTVLSVNTAHALAKRGCETLLIDIDPQNAVNTLLGASETAGLEQFQSAGKDRSLTEVCMEQIQELRNGLYTLSISALVDKLPMQTGTSEASVIGHLIEDLASSYDFVVVDTPPTWCGALEATVACSSLVVIPVDPSFMAVEAAVSLVNRIDQETPPIILLLRTMVSRQATRVSRTSATKIAERFPATAEENDALLPRQVALRGTPSAEVGGKPLFLSPLFVPRSERVHRLGFMKKSVFDNNDLPALQEAYRDIARELETLLASVEMEEERPDSEFIDMFAL